jgi:hypothetical protein
VCQQLKALLEAAAAQQVESSAAHQRSERDRGAAPSAHHSNPPPSRHQDRGNGAKPAASTSKSRLGTNHDTRDTIEARRRAVASITTAPEIDTITATNTVRTDTTTRDADDTTTVTTTATVAGNRTREACEPSG